MTSSEPPERVGDAGADPRPPAVTFVTTEHFVLQGSRASTIAESTGRANMFLASVSGALVALSALVALMRLQDSVWKRGDAARVSADEDEGPS